MRIEISDLLGKKHLCKAIMQTKVFVYPTDTVYGIGCNAENKELVKRILKIKKRSNLTMSVIAPSFNWICENFMIEGHEKLIKNYLPGPYTLILKLKEKKKNYLKHIAKNGKIGVRIPNHKISLAVSIGKKPIITTSANISGFKPPKSLAEIPKEIIKSVDVIITQKNESCYGMASTVIDCESGKIIRKGSGNKPLKF